MGNGGLDRVAVALDTSSWDRFEGWCRLFGPRVGALKVGLEAYLTWGERAVRTAGRWGERVFLDLKLHDIPTTVARAVRAVRRLEEVDYLTVHAAGGRPMLTAAAEAAHERPALLAVTLLTHLDEEELGRLDLPGAGAERVLRWAGIARDAGCSGAVCSPLELETLRPALPPPFRLVTPGVRPAAAAADDQRRTATPAEAVAAGADLLVMGRPLTGAADPEAALERLAAELR
ncbi:MAG: orotidine-5'-phosphate decarboxylase [Thermoanaerobaculia bacterium]|nr:orotidine-5'-phosphate decarboxylase [Thermoanaerobaculia bacterium]